MLAFVYIPEMILEREYPEGMVVSAITTARTNSKHPVLLPVVAQKYNKNQEGLMFLLPLTLDKPTSKVSNIIGVC